MKKLYLLGVFIMATVVMPAHGEISVLPLNKEVMKGAELESIPPGPKVWSYQAPISIGKKSCIRVILWLRYMNPRLL